VATIGVSIAIPSPYAEQLQARRASYGDPLAHSIPTHVTLLPPTEVRVDQLDGVSEHLAAVAKAHQPFALSLRGTGSFRPVSPVVFVQVAQGIVECEALEAEIRSGPLARELDFAYHPHVTVAHHVSDTALDQAFEELAGYTCEVDIQGFHLYAHGADRVWRPVRSFGFDGRVADAEVER